MESEIDGNIGKLPWQVQDQNPKNGPTGVIKWDPFWGNQTIQIYGKFEGVPFLPCMKLGLVIQLPLSNSRNNTLSQCSSLRASPSNGDLFPGLLD